MLLYHGFAAAALTDPALRRADAFANEASLRSFVSMALGLSLGVLLERVFPHEAEQVLVAHLARLEGLT